MKGITLRKRERFEDMASLMLAQSTTPTYFPSITESITLANL
jgi:hypothetical protein